MIPLLILIAGLIAWFATSYDTVGIILTIIGGTLAAAQVLFLLIGVYAARQFIRSTDPLAGLGGRRGSDVRRRR